MFRFSRAISLCMLIMGSLCSHADNHVYFDTQSPDSIRLQDHLYQWIGEEQPLASLVEHIQFFALWQAVNPNHALGLDDTKPVRLMLNITNPSQTRQELLLVHPHTTLNNIKLIYLSDGQIIQQYQAGNSLPFNERPITHRFFLFPVTIEPAQNITILIEADGILDNFITDFSLWKRSAFFERTDTQLIISSLYIGALLLFAIYNALLYAGVREISYLMFALFAFSLLIRALVENNFLFEFVWPNVPMMQNMTLVLSIVASSMLHTLFIMSYLSINKQKPKLLKAYQAFLLSLTVLIIYQAINGWPLSSISFLVMLAIPFSIFVWGSTAWLITQGSKNARSLLIAYTLLITVELWAMDGHLFEAKLPLNQKADLAQLLYIVILSFALSMRIGESREKAHIAYAKNKAKSDFLAKMSHEIRTPINGVLGMAQLLLETPLSRKQQHYADVISHCSKTLLNVINDILEYSKIEAGKLECEHTPFNLDALLLSNNALFWSQIQNKHLQYKFWIDPNIPHHLIGDPARLQQIFNNLFSNAVKFTDTGTIKLDVRLLHIDTNSSIAHIEFCLKDTGIGMNEDEIARIFLPFSQASSSTNRYYGGSGLGLSITKQLTELLGGTITVHSELRVGSGFSMELPFAIDTEAEYKRQESLTAFIGKRALILSDDVSEKDPVKITLRNWQIDTHCFTNIEDALAAMNKVPQDDFDVYCFSAYLLTGLHYEERALLQKVASKTLVYDHEFRPAASYYLHGFEGAHFLKAPFSLQQIQEQLSELLGLSLADGGKVAKANSTVFKPRSELRILVAEDDATNRLVIRAILKKLQIEHDIVANGLLVFERYKQTPDAYDMILMDCEMPEMNGYQAAEEIRSYEKQQKLKAIPIVALTAHVLPEYEARCYHSGMNMVIGKPIDIKILTDAFDQLCRDPHALTANNKSQTP